MQMPFSGANTGKVGKWKGYSLELPASLEAERLRTTVGPEEPIPSKSTLRETGAGGYN